MYSQANKICKLSDLVKHIQTGDTLAIGGGLSWREPMAALRELIRRQCRDLTLVGSAHGIDVDMLCGAGLVKESAESYVGFEQDFGMALNYRKACESGEVTVRDNCCYTLVQQLRAAIQGLPFMPLRSVQGTDIMKLHPEFKTMSCPFTGQTLVLVPALQPDVALLHVHFADRQGNLHIEGPPVADILFAKASKKVLVTAEQIISGNQMKAKGVTIPYFYITAVSEVPYGAHPTACYPNYAYDRQHTAEYYQITKQGKDAFVEHYLNPFVFECRNHDDYLDTIGGDKRLHQIEQWYRGVAKWMELYEA